jgi:hypothetical protein
LYPIINFRHTYYHSDNQTIKTIPEGSANSIEGKLSFYSLLHQSEQDIYPGWGIRAEIGSMYSLAGQINTGQLSYLSGIIYLPGFFKNHGIKLYGGYQIKDQVDFSLTDRIRYPRGYQTMDNQSMLSYGIDYKLPLLYPDIKFGRLVYIKRINLGFFYDQAFRKPIDVNDLGPVNLKSTGIEMLFTTNFLRFFAPVEIGFRSSYLFNNNFKTDFLFNVSFTL